MFSGRYILKRVSRFYNKSILAVLTISGIFAFIHRVFANAFELNFFEYLIEVFTSQKMFLYLLFVFYVFAITRTVTESSSQELIRFKSYGRYTFNFLASTVVIVSSFVMLLLLLYSIAGIGLPMVNEFVNTVYFLPALEDMDATPFVILLISLFHLILFLVTVTMILKAAFTWFDLKGYVIAVVLIFGLLVTSLGQDSSYWIFEFEAFLTIMNAYRILEAQFFIYYLVEFVFILLCFILIKNKWNRKKFFEFKKK